MSTEQQNGCLKVNEIKGKKRIESKEEEKIIKWISELKNENTIVKALENLSEYSEQNHNLAIYLWYSRGTMAILLHEIISTYQYLSSSKLTSDNSHKICCVITLLQCIASNNVTRPEFLESQIPIFLYPFLNNTIKTKPYEYLKLISLSVIGSLVKLNEPYIISFLIDTAITPILLKIMEKGSDLSKKFACCIVYQIIQDDNGNKYICEAKERYSAVIQYMKIMLKTKFNQRVTRCILKTFLRLSENKDARNILKNDLLKEIKDKNFIRSLDDSSKNLLNNLLKVLNEKDEFTQIKGINKINYNSNNNNMSNINPTNLKNMINHQSMNDEEISKQNINTNMMLVNQLNQMKMQQGFMISPNYTDANYSLYNNGNENYINKINYLNNQNSNKGYGNMNFYMYNNNI
jgi:CCR4-NOT transcription complex subunit 9